MTRTIFQRARGVIGPIGGIAIATALAPGLGAQWQPPTPQSVVAPPRDAGPVLICSKSELRVLRTAYQRVAVGPNVMDCLTHTAR